MSDENLKAGSESASQDVPKGAVPLPEMQMVPTVGFGISVDISGNVILELNLGKNPQTGDPWRVGAAFDVDNAEQFSVLMARAVKAVRYFKAHGNFDGFNPEA